MTSYLVLNIISLFYHKIDGCMQLRYLISSLMLYNTDNIVMLHDAYKIESYSLHERL